MSSPSRTKVFISYSHQDKRWLERLQVYLKPLEREGVIEPWDDTRIKPGSPWLDEIHGAIASARVAVLLVSADFLASDFIAEKELPPLLAAAEQDGARILPVIIGPSRFERTGLVRFQTVNPLDAPLIGMPEVERENTFKKVADAIEDALAWSGPKPADVEPHFPNDQTRDLSLALEEVYRRYEDILSTGGDTTVVEAEILDLKRKIREGGRLKPGDFLLNGRFKLLESVGHGGFATVWKSFDRQRHELVAIKVLHGRYAEDRTRRERLFRGARKMAALRHQGIVRVIEEERQDGGFYFFVMEYVEGGDLREAVLAGRLSQEDRLHIIVELGDALQFAHEHALVHRDVKPANVLLDSQQRPKLTDFDLVRAQDSTGGTRTGSLGTVIYAAPEAMTQAQEAGVPADIYGLGMTAVFALYGRDLPLEAFRDTGSFIEGLEASEGVKAVLRQATAWEWRDRQASVSEFCRALRVGVAGEVGAVEVAAGEHDREVRVAESVEPVEAPVEASEIPDSQGKVAGGWGSGFRWLMVLSLVVAVGVGSYLWWNRQKPVSDEDTPVVVPPVASDGDEKTITPETAVPAVSSLSDLETFRDRKKNGFEGPEMVVIPAGEFEMGSPETEKGRFDDERQHRVEIEQAFAIGKYEVTVGEFREFVEATDYRTEAERGDGCYGWTGSEWKKEAKYSWRNLGFSQEANHPVSCVSWNDAVVYAEWLSEQTGEAYRLPTEAEWEYAARAGTQTARFWGNDADEGCKYANAADQTAQNQFSGWTIMNCEDGFVYTAPVGHYQMNEFGLYDMLGNVWEWTCSEYDGDYGGAEKECAGNNRAGARRVIRGGSWYGRPQWVRSAYRYGGAPDERHGYVGFRLARQL